MVAWSVGIPGWRLVRKAGWFDKTMSDYIGTVYAILSAR
jgi:hypothetical protein